MFPSHHFSVSGLRLFLFSCVILDLHITEGSLCVCVCVCVCVTHGPLYR